MTDVSSISYKVNVMQAYERGEKIEMALRLPSNSGWIETNNPGWNWHDYTYRVAQPRIPDFIDKAHVNSRFKWMARDKNGWVYLYDSRPELCEAEGVWVNEYSVPVHINGVLASYREGNVDWTDSLVYLG